jgi:hypothetical protein
MSLATFGTIILVLAATAVLGGVLLRLAGALIFLAGALGLLGGGGPVGLLLVGLGAGLWLLGRAHRSLRSGVLTLPPGRRDARGPSDGVGADDRS